jgi:hypothetical protein
MPLTPDADEAKTVGTHTLAYQRTLDRKVDLVIEAMQRHGERLARVERDIGETRLELAQVKRDVLEVKGDIALLENKVITAQTEILVIVRRLDEEASGAAPSQ